MNYSPERRANVRGQHKDQLNTTYKHVWIWTVLCRYLQLMGDDEDSEIIQEEPMYKAILQDRQMTKWEGVQNEI